MPRCKAPEIPRSEAYILVRRSDEGGGQRRRWAFFSNLLMAVHHSRITMLTVRTVFREAAETKGRGPLLEDPGQRKRFRPEDDPVVIMPHFPVCRAEARRMDTHPVDPWDYRYAPGRPARAPCQTKPPRVEIDAGFGHVIPPGRFRLRYPA
jgi:hypothetical protein